ncbi:uncharacterized protein LOC126842236, partial [Adelges cooleyi]|uniref:uncharacterized protein LOC126842236 n=1 Tax=Adelges cooleyi TaxID=133065 RepID=UPI00217F4EEA
MDLKMYIRVSIVSVLILTIFTAVNGRPSGQGEGNKGKGPLTIGKVMKAVKLGDGGKNIITSCWSPRRRATNDEDEPTNADNKITSVEGGSSGYNDNRGQGLEDKDSEERKRIGETI